MASPTTSSLRKASGRRSHRRAFPGAAIAVCALLGACSSEGAGDWSRLFELARSSWEDHSHLPLSTVADIPYATMGVRIGDDPEQMLVLATDTDGEQLWTTSSRVAISTRRGRIVATAGLPRNLTAYTTADHQDSWLVPRTFAWHADLADMGQYSVRIDCTDTPGQRETISILGAPLDTVRVDETCRSDAIGWSYANTYWVSRSTGWVWRSIQHVHPGMEALEIEILRPPLSAQ
ncbi:MAG: YjbF family lipoprotein [Rhizomicrobium sp.]